MRSDPEENFIRTNAAVYSRSLLAPNVSPGLDVSWDDFLPSLSYVIVECNWPYILIEVEYMMELLEPSWLGGEGTTPILSNHFTINITY